MNNILVYTDSRGLCIGSNKYPSYITLLENDDNINIQKSICSEKWTTTIDFIRYINSINISRYDYIILQTSVVDNSPRIKSDAYNKIYLDPKKKIWFDKIFGQTEMLNHFKTDFGDSNRYESEYTTNLYSIESAIKYLIPVLDSIPNLIWISNNPLVGYGYSYGYGSGSVSNIWNGDYWKYRPNNISIVNEYSKQYIENMKNTKYIDNTNWTEQEIKDYTTDNIHYTKKGMEYVYEKLKQLIL